MWLVSVAIGAGILAFFWWAKSEGISIVGNIVTIFSTGFFGAIALFADLGFVAKLAGLGLLGYSAYGMYATWTLVEEVRTRQSEPRVHPVRQPPGSARTAVESPVAKLLGLQPSGAIDSGTSTPPRTDKDPSSISPEARAVLNFLKQSGGSTFSEMEDAFSITPQRVSELMHEIEEVVVVTRLRGGRYTVSSGDKST